MKIFFLFEETDQTAGRGAASGQMTGKEDAKETGRRDVASVAKIYIGKLSRGVYLPI